LQPAAAFRGAGACLARSFDHNRAAALSHKFLVKETWKMRDRRTWFYRSVILAFFATLALGGPAARAQEADQKFQLDFDTADGNFSEWKVQELGDAKRLRAVVKSARLGKHDRWQPFLRITSKSAPDEYWGLLMSAKNNAALPSVSAVHCGSKIATQEVPFALVMSMNQRRLVELSRATPAKLILRSGDETHELPMTASATGISVPSGTGEFLVNDIRLHND
jgi:hypothetical protein